MRLSDDQVIGYDIYFLAENSCISGSIAGNKISKVTTICPPYGDRGLIVSELELWSLSDYQLLDRDLSDWEREMLQDCVDYFDGSYI